MNFIDDLENITIDDEMLKLLGLTKKELQEILEKNYIKNKDYVDLQTQTEEEIKTFEKKCKNNKKKSKKKIFICI